MDPRVEKILKLPLYVRVLIVVAIACLVAVLYYFTMFAPLVDKYSDLKKQHSQLETRLIQDRRIASNLPKFKAEYERMQQQLELALAELPNKKEIPKLLTSISSLAKDQGLEILRFQPSGEKTKEFYAEVPVKMHVIGSFHDLVLFFDRVGKLDRIVNINNLTVSRAKRGGEKQKNFINVQFLATTFRFLESKGSK